MVASVLGVVIWQRYFGDSKTKELVEEGGVC